MSSILGFGFSMFMCGVFELPRQKGIFNLFTGTSPSAPANRQHIARETGLKLASFSSYGCFGLAEHLRRVCVLPLTCFGYSATD